MTRDPRRRGQTYDEKCCRESLGKKIAELREEPGLTQTQLAELLSLTQRQVGHFEDDRGRVPVSSLPALARAFGASVEDEIGEDLIPGKRTPAPSTSDTSSAFSSSPGLDSASSSRSPCTASSTKLD